MSRGITLKGAAAKAFIEGSMGLKPKTDDDKHMRIATYVHMEMATKTRTGERKAALIVKCIAEEGLDKALDLIEGRA